jgi:hypothetical protein
MSKPNKRPTNNLCFLLSFLALLLALEVETERFSKTLLKFNQTIRRQIPKEVLVSD